MGVLEIIFVLLCFDCWLVEVINISDIDEYSPSVHQTFDGFCLHVAFLLYHILN